MAGLASSVAASPDGVPAPPSFSLLLETADGLVSVTLADDARVVDAVGETIEPGSIPLGARVRAEGETTPPDPFVAREVIVLP